MFADDRSVLFSAFTTAGTVVEPERTTVLVTVQEPITSTDRPVTNNPAEGPGGLVLRAVIVTVLTLVIPDFPTVLWRVNASRRVPGPADEGPGITKVEWNGTTTDRGPLGVGPPRAFGALTNPCFIAGPSTEGLPEIVTPVPTA